MTYRICNTPDLRVLARKPGAGQLDPGLNAQLDPEGTHVLTVVLFGHNMDAGKPLQHKIRRHGEVPVTSPESDALSKELKKLGFGFVGSVSMYALMQSSGLIQDHAPGCFRRAENF